MSAARLVVVILVPLLFLVPFAGCGALASSSPDLVALAIDGAEAAVDLAYDAVLEAEQAGADVSGLLVKLNEAGAFLARAHVAFRLGDLEEADRLAALCLEVVAGVSDEADELRLGTYRPKAVNVLFAVFSSFFSALAVAFGGFWVWRVFKRRYYRRVLKARPEVAKGES